MIVLGELAGCWGERKARLKQIQVTQYFKGRLLFLPAEEP